jgi:hypothetical protein
MKLLLSYCYKLLPKKCTSLTIAELADTQAVFQAIYFEFLIHGTSSVKAA